MKLTEVFRKKLMSKSNTFSFQGVILKVFKRKRFAGLVESPFSAII